MLRKYIAWMLCAVLLSLSQLVWAQSGDLFSISSSGTVGSVQVRVCLNGKGPTSCENHTVSNFTLSINTTIANHTYPQIGIKSVTPGYSFTGCTMYSNGYCIFSASDTSAANVTITASSDIVSLTNVNPSSGSASGGTGITLTGTNLTGTTSVTFGGTSATSVNVVNATTVTAVTPAHAVGAVDVVITTSNGSSTLTSGYTYNTTAIGQSAFGGVIACLNGGSNNLIASAADNSTGIFWGGQGTLIGASAQSTTDGASNTAAIVAGLGSNGGTPYAAKTCDDYEVDSQGNTPCQAGNTCYNDWFLPAGNNTGVSGQLNCLYTNRVAIGGFSVAAYWSSTEFDINNARAQIFNGSGTQLGATKDYNISPLIRARCVRAFTP